jgi:hypothetical protein
MGKSLLTLDTLEPDRDFISVDGKAYYMRGDDELSLTQFARIRRLSSEVAASGIADEASEEDMTKVENYINSILDVIILGMLPDVRDKLTPKQKFQVVEAFTTAASSRRAEATAEKPITEG